MECDIEPDILIEEQYMSLIKTKNISANTSEKIMMNCEIKEEEFLNQALGLPSEY